MKRVTLFFILTAFFTSGYIAAQQQHACGTMEYYRQTAAMHPEVMKRLEKINQQAFEDAVSEEKGADEVFFIPVVVHVVYNTSVQNISMDQIQSQIDVLNEDYARTNADAGQTPSNFQSVAADTKIRFCLAQRDPSGQASNGVTRTQTSAQSFPLGGSVKSEATGGKSGWPSDQYLNIWVCNLVDPLIGFATLPGTALPGQDGVVITYKHFGRTGQVQAPYNKGRTATHEVGHWLNLLHIWGDDENSSDACAGTDQIEDTPNQSGPYFGCPSGAQTSCGSSDMFMNYMDYTNDACMNMFTTGQKVRMRSALAGFRSTILTSLGCSVPPVANDCDTINHIIGGDGLVYYLAEEYLPDESGYLTGTNSMLQPAFAEAFSTTEEKAVWGARIDFSFAHAASPGATVRILVYNSDGPDNTPGTVLTQKSYSLETIEINVENFTYSDIEFDTPALVNGDYYIGFETNLFTGDSIAVYTNQFDEVNTNTAWLKTSASEWISFDQVAEYDGPISLAIKSIECSTVGFDAAQPKQNFTLFPNPAQSGSFSVYLPANAGKTQWQVFATDGKLCGSGIFSSSSYQQLEFDAQKGLYYVRLIPENGAPVMIPAVVSGY
ncbi:MAG: hypothetical protein KDC13_04030 [Bacteroidetes bacterium]|nr:hypothetical protein [Bacteroidota bacterium]